MPTAFSETEMPLHMRLGFRLAIIIEIVIIGYLQRPIGYRTFHSRIENRKFACL